MSPSKRSTTFLFSILTVSGFAVASFHAQDPSATGNPLAALKTVVVTSQVDSDSVIAVPPATSVSFPLRNEKHPKDSLDLNNWLDKETGLNGLQSTSLRPWHIVVVYDQFDEDGDNVHSGVYEEYWAGPQKYKRIYKSDNLNQTDYATEKGLYRSGDQKWPDRAQLQARAEIVDPFSYALTLQDVYARNQERILNRYKLQCVVIELRSGISDPTQYCFEADTSILRYFRGEYWFQTAYNQITSFQGRNVAREVVVTDGGKRYLELHVKSLEVLTGLDDSQFNPPSDAAGPLGDRVSGIAPIPIDMKAIPQWPPSLRAQHFTVTFDAVIGKDGHVISTHPVSGPPEAYKGCEDAIRKWIFKPYLIIGKPVEMETKFSCNNN
jgi:hypothetical protein